MKHSPALIVDGYMSSSSHGKPYWQITTPFYQTTRFKKATQRGLSKAALEKTLNQRVPYSKQGSLKKKEPYPLYAEYSQKKTSQSFESNEASVNLKQHTNLFSSAATDNEKKEEAEKVASATSKMDEEKKAEKVAATPKTDEEKKAEKVAQEKKAWVILYVKYGNTLSKLLEPDLTLEVENRKAIANHHERFFDALAGRDMDSQKAKTEDFKNDDFNVKRRFSKKELIAHYNKIIDARTEEVDNVPAKFFVKEIESPIKTPFDINFIKREKIYTKLKYSRSPAYDIVSGGVAALFAGFIGFLISEKFGIELVDSGDFYTGFMYAVLVSYSIRSILRLFSTEEVIKSVIGPSFLINYISTIATLVTRFIFRKK
jgi:hypothetical protein